MTSFRVRAGGVEVMAALSRNRSTGRCYCSFVECSPDTYSQQAKMGTKSELFINLANIFLPVLVISSDPTPPNFLTQPELLSAAFPYQWTVMACTVDFPKSSQKSTNPQHVLRLLLSSPKLGTRIYQSKIAL